MIRVGTSGWSYPTWRPGFYPAGMQQSEFLRYYADRFDTVELNVTGYRLPSAEQFRRWAEAVPPDFRFAVKLPLARADRAAAFFERVEGLGDRLGPIRVVVEGPRDEGLVAFVAGSAPPGAELAWDLRDSSWDGIEGLVRVDDFEAEPFRYVRLREPPYSDTQLAAIAERLRAPAYVYIRHEDEPSAPAIAARLLTLPTRKP